MRSFVIKNQKLFTAKLFADTLFDSFLLCDATFMTNQTYNIDGHVLTDYYDSESDKPAETYTTWANSRPICFQMIKGKRLPVFFKVVLTVSSGALKKILADSGCAISPTDVEGVYLNIHYKEGTLFCTSGISLKTFSMDKTFPNYWDELVSSFFVKNGFEFEN
ncbi:MAG: DUF5721 family protein [Lachnospiraceae bacterium]|nr:DUF5721 family protein [Lachnospiraceae bacterium]